MSTTTVNGTPVPGLLNSFGSPPIGVQTTSPQANMAPPKNTIPSSQIAPKDLSKTYANVGGTIYNKQSGSKFANQADFFKDSGVNSFSNLKFDMAYAPTGKETIYGQPQASPQTQTSPITPNSPTVPSNPVIQPQAPYSPPNQGTTGVSQGGIIGNLINTANNENPEVTKARTDLKTLQESNATANANIESEPIDLSLASGQKGILSRLFAAKEGAAQTALSSALTSQGQQIGATTSAGQLNAPVQAGGYMSPSANTTTGQTTSGAGNINSLVGQRQVPGQQQAEFFNSQTGQGFSTPQQLSDFVNKQTGANTTAQNVFDYLKSQQGQGQGGGALNPINNVSSIAQQVISGQISPSQAYAMGGSVANWQGLLNAELQKAQPGFDQSAAQAKYDSNQAVQGSQARQKAQYQSAYQQGQNLQSQLVDLINKFGLNPNDVNALNSGIQAIAQNVSSPQYKALNNLVTDIVATYSSILTPGSTTDTARATAASLIDASASGQSIIATLKALDQQAQAKIQGTQTPSTTGNSNSNSSTLGLF